MTIEFVLESIRSHAASTAESRLELVMRDAGASVVP
jgi:hypothetical protein